MTAVSTRQDVLSTREPRLDSRWSQTSWGAVVAGVVTAIGLQFLMTVLGMALGLSAGSAESTSDSSIGSIGMVAGLWWLFSGTVSLAVGGMVLGRLWSGVGGCELRLHALALWGVVAIFGFMVIWTGAGIASNAVSPLATVVGRDTPSTSSRTTDPSRMKEFQPESAEERTARVELARQAARTASWWSVVGMLLGAGATVGGAMLAAQASRDARAVGIGYGRVAPTTA